MNEGNLSWKSVIYISILIFLTAFVSILIGIERGQSNQMNIDAEMIQNIIENRISLKDHVTLILDKRVLDVINETLIEDYPNETALCLHGYKYSTSNRNINQTSYRIIFARKANIISQDKRSIDFTCLSGTLMRMHTHPINDLLVEYCSPSPLDLSRIEGQLNAIACGTNKSMTGLVFYNNFGNMINDYEIIDNKYVYYGNVIRIK